MKSLIIIILFGLSLVASAQEGLLNKLLAPGPLMDGHSKLESKDCLKCHNVGKGIDNGKCLDCHKEIKPFVLSKKGFHGLTLQNCIACHSDHKGKDYDAVAVDEKTFDHKKTGYVLAGKHAQISCNKCHTATRKGKYVRPNDTRYFSNSNSCVSCHKKDDVHFYTGDYAKKDCGSCHGLTTWKKDVKFDHFKDTQYELIGKHKTTSCAKCHVPSKDKPIYKWPNLKKQQCLSCHEDYHKKNINLPIKNDCLKCHAPTQETWKIPEFNHAITGYVLKGKHAALKCTDCHKINLKLEKKDYQWTGLKTACASCHKDIHEYGDFKSQRNPTPYKCETCHNEKSWKEVTDFQHNRDTRFIITGKHLNLQCNKCHIRPKQEVPVRQYHWEALESKTCENCHKNPHLNSFSKEALARKCTACHSADGWKTSPTRINKDFNHDETRFKIDGAHTPLACNACHIKSGQQVFKFPSFEKKFCIDCHRTPHKEQFNESTQEKSCVDCHNTVKFNQLKPFDHNEVHFKLTGQHAKIKCDACHVKTNIELPVKPPRPMHKYMFPGVTNKTCISCHQDIHRGLLGNDCQKCHMEESWKKINFDHNKMSRFPLRDKHADVKCSKCHVPSTKFTTTYKNEVKPLVVYKPLSMGCYSCHAKNDVHKGEYGRACQDCHNEKGWKHHQDFHKDFTLSGAHYTLSCNECHINDRRLGGMSDNCYLCHQKDDIHFGSIPNCGACHRQDFWEQTRFRHSMTNFPLRGSHRVAECISCHSNGIYEGTPSQCVDCHLKEYIQAVPDHTASGFSTKCTDCHNQFRFGN